MIETLPVTPLSAALGAVIVELRLLVWPSEAERKTLERTLVDVHRDVTIAIALLGNAATSSSTRAIDERTSSAAHDAFMSSLVLALMVQRLTRRAERRRPVSNRTPRWGRSARTTDAARVTDTARTTDASTNDVTRTLDEAKTDAARTTETQSRDAARSPAAAPNSDRLAAAARSPAAAPNSDRLAAAAARLLDVLDPLVQRSDVALRRVMLDGEPMQDVARSIAPPA